MYRGAGVAGAARRGDGRGPGHAPLRRTRRGGLRGHALLRLGRGKPGEPAGQGGGWRHHHLLGAPLPPLPTHPTPHTPRAQRDRANQSIGAAWQVRPEAGTRDFDPARVALLASGRARARQAAAAAVTTEAAAAALRGAEEAARAEMLARRQKYTHSLLDTLAAADGIASASDGLLNREGFGRVVLGPYMRCGVPACLTERHLLLHIYLSFCSSP